MKKGFVVQFNLIFVIIVGVMVLAFFLFFTSKYIDLNQKKEAAEISNEMNNIMRGLRSTTQYKNLSVMFNFNYDLDCNTLIINNKFSQDTDSILFGEDGSSKKLVFWSKEFRKPFRVDNLIFLINNNKKYYSPDNFFPNFINKGNVGDYDVGVFFGADCPVTNSIPGRRIICVSNDDMFIDGVSYPFVDESFVYAAAFSDIDQYECGFNKSMEKWKNLFDIYIKKNEMLSGCSEIRNQIDSELISLRSNLNSGIYVLDVNHLESLNVNLDNFECGVVY